MTLAIPLALAAALAAPQPSPPDAPQPALRAIRVSGEGRDFATPDVARVTVGVEAQHRASLARATADATARMKKVIAAIEAAGVAPRDIRTSRYDVDVQRSYERSSAGPPGTITGFRVTNQVAVTVRDLSRLGALLDQVVAAGSNSIDRLVLDKEDTSAERARALAAAVADARAKATALAASAGVTLGEVLQVVEGVRGATPLEIGNFFGGPGVRGVSADVPVAAGRLELAASVDVTFGIR